jgi:3-phenylpropionate/cinnamic acid dioxygenase small subunit
MTETAVKPDIREIEEFLYREADFLDRGDLDGWIELYTEDASYWMPASPEQTDPFTHISLFYDDRLLMEIRRINFGHEYAASMAHPVRSTHIIGNVRLQSFDAATGEARVTSNFHVAMYYRGEQTLYAGRYTHDLVRQGNDWKIRHKRVDILTCDAPLKSIIIYL